MTESNKSKEVSFEEAMKELENIVGKLEKGDLPLEDAIQAYQRGMELSHFCQLKLSQAEGTVAKLMTEQSETLLDEDE